MYRRQTRTHHQSQDDVSHHVGQYTRMATERLHTPSGFGVNHRSIDAAPNANGTIWMRRIRANAVTLLIAPQPVFQLSNVMIQTAICPKSPECWNQDRPEEVVLCEFHHAGLDGLAVSRQSRIVPFEADRNVCHIVPVIQLQFGEHWPFVPEKFDADFLIILHPRRWINRF
jgi:hypothetical protein